MVIYDIESGNCNEELIDYDHMIDRSVRIPFDTRVLEDITGESFTSKEYINRAKKRKRNINPILREGD